MKAITTASLLFAALSSLSLVLSFGFQPRDVPDPRVVACANNADCTAARTDLIDCLQNAQSDSGHASDDVTNCLCVFGQGAVTPWHPGWTDRLESCIVCVEEAAGLDNTISRAMQSILGVHNSFGGLCKKTLDLGQMVRDSTYLGYENNFPLSLPDASLRNNSTAAKRSVITLTKTSFVTVTKSTIKPGTSSLLSMGNLNTLTASVPIVTPFLPQSSALSSLHSSKLRCNQDNCLRQCIRESSAVAEFCSTYTKSAYTATLGLPDAVSHCKNDPTRISSACFCLATVAAVSITSSHISSSQTVAASLSRNESATALSSSMVSSSSSASSSSGSATNQFQAASSQSIVHASTTTLKSTIKSIIIVTVAPVKATSSGPSPSTMTSTSPSTQLPSSNISLKPLTTPFAADTTQASSSQYSTSPTSTLTPSTPSQSISAFPISPQMQACQFSKTTCEQAGMLFTQCLENTDPANTTTWDCLCTTNFMQWNSTLNSCSDCIAKALPQNNPNATWQASQVLEFVNMEVSTYCNLKGVQQGSRDTTLINGGRVLTSAFQSPILWFNMTAIDAPIAWPPIPIAISGS